MNIPIERPNSLEEHWMPFSANRSFKEKPRMVSKASGLYYTGIGGDQIIDGSSGLFCVGAGHGRREIADAVSNVLLEMDYVPAFNYGHPLSFELSRRLAAMTPGDLNYIFYANSGSEAVDTALKIALAYQRARGEGARQRLIGRERGYHGVNFGGLSVAGMVNNKRTFGLGLPGVAHMRHTWQKENCFTRGQAEDGKELAEDLQRFVDLYGSESIAACIVEPVAGSTGCLVPPKGYLERLREICDSHGIVLIFDEVICAFARMGTQFGADYFGVTPDIMTMAKALTNGVVPMGAVACSETIYNTVTSAAAEGAVELFHGYTYSGCPVATAAALATRDIFDDEGLVERSVALSPGFLDALYSLQEFEVITDIRGIGLLGGIDFAPTSHPGGRNAQLTQATFDAGLIIKMTGDCMLLAPPFVSEEKHIDEIFTKLRKILKSI